MVVNLILIWFLKRLMQNPSEANISEFVYFSLPGCWYLSVLFFQFFVTVIKRPTCILLYLSLSASTTFAHKKHTWLRESKPIKSESGHREKREKVDQLSWKIQSDIIWWVKWTMLFYISFLVCWSIKQFSPWVVNFKNEVYVKLSTTKRTVSIVVEVTTAWTAREWGLIFWRYQKSRRKSVTHD